MFSNNENSRPQNARSKMPKIDLDPFRVLNSLFSSNSPNVKSCCESCSAKFGLIKPKKICHSCKFEFCSNCFKLETDLGGARSTVCLKCRVFSKRPLKKEDLIKLKVKELKWFLRSHRISSSLCKEKSDLVDLIIQDFGLRSSGQNGQAGPSRRSTDDSAANRRDNSTRNSSTLASENASQNASPLRSATNSNSDNSNESTLGSEWEIFANERFSSHNSSNNNSNPSSNRNSTHNSNHQSPTSQTPTNEATLNNNDLNSEFVNLTTANEESGSAEVNSNDANFTVLDNASAFENNNVRPSNQTNDDLSDRFNSSLNEPTSSTSSSENSRRRLSNSNLNNLNKPTNLSESTESLSSFKNFNIADVTSEDEIKRLSVRQLKLVLTRNYVNYKGCCEKEELQEKAIRLWNQIKQDNDLIDDTKDEDLCKICMENVINCVLLECGHLVTCLDCGKRLSECPVCRQYVVRALRTFKS